MRNKFAKKNACQIVNKKLLLAFKYFGQTCLFCIKRRNCLQTSCNGPLIIGCSGSEFRNCAPYFLVIMRLSKIINAPQSVWERISLPEPCRNLSTACGRLYCVKLFCPCFWIYSILALVMARLGGVKGNFTITTVVKPVPLISTPSQKLLAPKTMVFSTCVLDCWLPYLH